jgi:hypothetical protein
MLTREQVEEKLGGYNSMPPNWEEIYVSEFLWKFGQKNHDAFQAFRQVVLPTVGFGQKQKHIGAKDGFCHVFFWVNADYSGVGFIIHYNGMATRSETDAFFPQYFKFHYCEHDFETTISRMSYWEGKCKKCGYVKAVDSSD